MVNSPFSEWLSSELEKRGLSQSELARLAGVSRGAISHLINQTRKPGPEICEAIAHALKLPPETVFRVAGLLSPKPDIQTEDQQFLYLLHLMDELSREELLEFMKFKLEHKAANKATSRGKKPARSALI